MYKIGELSKLSQIPVKTLRYYDEIELLRPAHIQGSTGYRYYAAAQFERLNRILVLKDLGFSLREIQALLAENVPPGQIQELLRLRLAELERRVRREKARLARATARLALLEQGALAAANDVAIRMVGPHLVASVRDIIGGHDECERLFQELDHGLGRRREGGRRGAIWHACEDGRVDCEVFEVLAARLDVVGRIRVREMEDHRIASLVYRGDRDFLGAYRSIRAWIAASGVETAGPKREIYLDNGRGEGESVTEIQFPIASAPESVH